MESSSKPTRCPLVSHQVMVWSYGDATSDEGRAEPRTFVQATGRNFAPSFMSSMKRTVNKNTAMKEAPFFIYGTRERRT